MGNKISLLADEDNDLRKFHKFTIAEINEWSTTFKSLYPSKRLKLCDLELLIQEYFPEPEERTIEYVLARKRFCKQLFSTLNISESGTVTFNEILISFNVLYKGSVFEKTMWLFRYYDSDKNGLVTKSEMVSAIRDLYTLINTEDDEKKSIEYVNKMFECLNKRITNEADEDVNNDQSLNINDFQTIISSINSEKRIQ